jgi:cytochrome P450
MAEKYLSPVEEFNPFDKGWMTDPYPVYRRLRESGPVQWSPRAHAWLVTGHAEVKQVLRDRDAAPNDLAAFMRSLSQRAGKPLVSLVRVFEAILFFQHGPDHTVGRRFLGQVLNGRPLDALVPDMHAVAGDLLTNVWREGGFDATSDFAELMPYLVMGRVLGIEAEDILWMARQLNGFMVVFDRGCSLRELEHFDQRMQMCMEMLEVTIRLRRRTPLDDGISRLVDGGQADKLTDADLAARCMFLMLTGSETTATFVGNAFRLLIEFPEQKALLRDGRASVSQAVEELLRFESPVQQTVRIAGVNTVLGGVSIEAGQSMLLMISAANRDPLVFADPERLQLDRDASAQLAFTAGMHQCLGERLARLEAAVAIEQFLKLPRMRLTKSRPDWWSSHVLRRLQGLKIEPA